MKTVLLVLGAIMLGTMLSAPASAQPAPGQAAKPKIAFKGGPGDTTETAVVILGASDSKVGIDAEYSYLEKKFGRRNYDWKLKRQGVYLHKGKVYDRMEIDLKDGGQKTLFFDISEFFGKF
jgi:hypothetical protein